MSHLLWVGAVVGAVVYICWDRLRVGLPPGPKGVPLVGSWSALRGHPRYVVLTRWAKQYGEFYSFRVGSRNTFVVSGAAALDELFNKKGALYNTRPQSSAQAHRVTGDTRGVALPYGEPWRVCQLRILLGRFTDIFAGATSSPPKPSQRPERQVLSSVSGLRKQSRSV